MASFRFEAQPRRLRVFTLLMRAYDAARDASLYLSSRDPQIAALPSLYRRRRRHKAEAHVATAATVAPAPND